MSGREKEILKTFERIIPRMTDLQKEKLLSFGEGIETMMDHTTNERLSCKQGNKDNQ